MEELTRCPSTLAPGFNSYSPIALKRLFDKQKISQVIPYISPDSNDKYALAFTRNQKRVALCGTQTKYSIIAYNNKFLKLSSEKHRGHYILKTIPKDILNAADCPANENLTMQIAEQVFKIETAANGLCFFRNGEMAYFTRRFDIAGKENKFRVEDFATLAGISFNNTGSNYKFELSYEELAELIKKIIPAWRIELVKFYRLILFNFLFSNGNAHLKKFSIIETPDGDFQLTPAYGLLNTRIHGNELEFALEKGLFKNRDRKLFKGGAWAIGSTFRAFGVKIGLQENIVDKELSFFKTWHPAIEELVNNSFLSNENKKVYFAQYRLRRRRLTDMEV